MRISQVEYARQVTALTPPSFEQIVALREIQARRINDQYKHWRDITGIAFINAGLWAYVMRRYEFWRYLPQPETEGSDEPIPFDSFDQWAALSGDSHTSVHLQAQVYEICAIFFRLPQRVMYGIGEKKYGLIAPFLRGLMKDVLKAHEKALREWREIDPAYRELRPPKPNQIAKWQSCRKTVLYWLEEARHKSYSQLEAEGMGRRGYDVLFMERVNVGMLRQAGSVAALLEMLGLSGQPDEYNFQLILRRRKQDEDIEAVLAPVEEKVG